MVHAAATASLPADWVCDRRQRRALIGRKRQRAAKTASARLAARQWEASDKLRGAVGRDLDYWTGMRWIYQGRGFCDPERLITDGIVKVRAFGHPVRARGDAATKLLQVERNLAEQGHTPSFEWIGGFNARTVRGPFGPSKHLSNHALGKAIDFDPHLNPYLSSRELAFIHRITGVRPRRSRRTSAGKRWDDFKRAEDLWLERIGPWLRRTQATMARLRASRRQRGKLRRLQRDYELATTSANLLRARESGFLGLTREFVVEMEQVGFWWRTDFKPGPDFMHFEWRK